MLSPVDESFLALAHARAEDARREGNRPVGCVICSTTNVVGVGWNRTRHPHAAPARHAEMEALGTLGPGLIPECGRLTCYTTLEPCVMCFSALVLHGIGRVVFGAADHLGGALRLRPHLPALLRAQAAAVRWVGPLGREFDLLRDEVLAPHYARGWPRPGPGSRS